MRNTMQNAMQNTELMHPPHDPKPTIRKRLNDFCGEIDERINGTANKATDLVRTGIISALRLESIDNWGGGPASDSELLRHLDCCLGYLPAQIQRVRNTIDAMLSELEEAENARSLVEEILTCHHSAKNVAQAVRDSDENQRAALIEFTAGLLRGLGRVGMSAALEMSETPWQDLAGVNCSLQIDERQADPFDGNVMECGAYDY